MNLLSRLDPRTHQALTTAGAMYAGRFGTALALLVTIPLARSELSPGLFGAWMMLSALLGFFAFADLGVGNGVLNHMTAARALGDTRAIRRVLVAGYVCTTSVGLALLILWFAWCLVADDPTRVAGRVAAEDRTAVLAALHIFVALLAINLPSSLVQKIQLAAQEGYWVGIAQLVVSLITLVAVPTALLLGGSLPILVVASIGTLVAGNVGATALWLARRRLLSGSIVGDVHLPTIASLLRTGVAFLAIQIASALAFQSDAIVITHVLGTEYYGDFAAVQRLFVFASMLVSAALVGLWPAFGDSLVRGDVAWARQAFRTALKGASLFMLVLCMALTATMGWITKSWLGTESPPPLLLTSLLAIWAMTDALGMVVGTFLNGAGVLRAQAIVAMVMALVSFAGKWVLVGQIGVAGGVLATIIAYYLVSVPAQIILTRRLLRVTPQ